MLSGMDSKDSERLARLRAHITALRIHLSGELGKRLSPERRHEMLVALRAAIKKLTTGRKV
jgi:hypothetical protein